MLLLVAIWLITCLVVPPLHGNTCVCDIRPMICEKFCQCDPGCSIEDWKSFNNSHSKEKGRWCIPKVLYFSSSTTYIKSQENENLCFSDDAFVKQNFFNAKYDTSKLQWKSIYTNTLNFWNACTETSLCVLYKSNMLGRFTIPSDQGCLISASPRFLSNTTTKCNRMLNLTDGGTSCAQLPNILTYTDQLQFIRLPISKFTESGVYNIEAITASQSIKSIVSITCKDSNDSIISCQKSLPVFDTNTRTCKNVITGVTYKFAYNENGLTEASVEFKFSNVVTEVFDESYTVQFVEGNNVINQSALVQPLFTDYRSGSPGYLKNYPIRAAYAQTDTSKSQIIMSTYPSNPSIYPNLNNEINFGWWPIPNSGDCEEQPKLTGRIKTILFGQDTYSSCVLRLKSFVGNPINCTTLETQIKSILNYGQTPITHVGVWEANNINLINGTKSWACQNVITGQTIHIFYARKGALYSLQNSIISVQRIYKRGTISYICQGYSCVDVNRNPEQQFFLTTNIRFFDITSK
uniref:Tectonic-1-3 domain-containing protein n=1 Tax=Trichobilharzia regenti TaxID=157069 RepID=A0AA85JMN7_TRIRE|nr:unnamed protein product [Trichobilharzia regenti]